MEKVDLIDVLMGGVGGVEKLGRDSNFLKETIEYLNKTVVEMKPHERSSHTSLFCNSLSYN